ncbi:MAG: hypothetical protein PHW33_04770 [Candidatus Portnoybacteria bacterium]|nr:hypothetical protein [Candidatus Portnoybacteria bacterium]
MIRDANYVDDKEKYSELMVLQSAAGYYVGTMYTNEDGYEEPGSRDSDYFRTRNEAEIFLKYTEQSNDEDFLRKDP